MMKAQQRKSTILCIAIGLSMTLLSLCISMLVFDTRSDELPPDAPAATSLPYDESMPFSLSDLTNEQLLSIRKDGRLAVSDGPRGISIGDTLDELLARYPSTIARTDAAAQQDVSMTDEEMQTYTDEYRNNQDSIVQTGIQSDEEMIIYCA